jgi:catechol 2,3-dioxygenase-like lactoylglutathione lyase family enzyme
MTIRRALPVLKSADLRASRAFYVDVLGFEVAMDEPGFLMIRSPSVPTTQIILIDADASQPFDPLVGMIDVSCEVEDVDAIHDRVEARGMEVLHPLTDESWGIRRFFVREPGGTVVNVAMHRR